MKQKACDIAADQSLAIHDAVPLLKEVIGIFRRYPCEPDGVEIEVINEGLDEADRLSGPTLIADRFRQKP